MTNVLQPFCFGIIVVMILHFLIKHYLLYSIKTKSSNLLKKKVRFTNNQPNIHYISDDILEDNKYKDSENIDVKNHKVINVKDEILKYLNTNNTSNNIISLNKEAQLNKFFQMDHDEKYILDSNVDTKQQEQLELKSAQIIDSIKEGDMEPYEDINSNTYHSI